MVFTIERIRQLCPLAHETIISGAIPALEEQAAAFELNTVLRRAHFIGQLAHESDQFRRIVENLDYSAGRIAQVWPRLAPRAQELEHAPEKLANAAYGGRMGNGDEASGDGWRFRGRGLLQITGRSNYALTGVLDDPDSAADPATAARIALTLWDKWNCNSMADSDDIEAITRKINGGLNGLAQRRNLVERAKTIFIDDGDSE